MTEVKTDPRRDEAEEFRTEAARLRERIGQLEPRHARALDDADEADSKIAEIGRRREALVMDLYGGDEAAASEDSGLRDEVAELVRRSEVAKGAASRFDEDLADLRRRLAKVEEEAERAAHEARYRELGHQRYRLDRELQGHMDALVEGLKELGRLKHEQDHEGELVGRGRGGDLDWTVSGWVVASLFDVVDVRQGGSEGFHAAPLHEQDGRAFAPGDE